MVFVNWNEKTPLTSYYIYTYIDFLFRFWIAVRLAQCCKLASLIFWFGQINLYDGLEFNHVDLSGMDELISYLADEMSEKKMRVK